MMPKKPSAAEPPHVCPWWVAYTFDNPLRRIFHRVPQLLGDYVKEGMTVMDVGCGMGYFTIGMAGLVGPAGKVIAVDLQQKMLDVMLKRAHRAGVAARIIAHLCQAGTIGIEKKADFILAFWMVHEVGDQRAFFNQLKSNLAAGGKILIAEPKMHVTRNEFEKTLEFASGCGLKPCGEPPIRFSRTGLLE